MAVAMAACCFPFRRRHAKVSPAQGSNKSLLDSLSRECSEYDFDEGDQDARRELAVRILPFVPRRVAASFASGLYSTEPNGLTTWAVPSPRRLEAAVLLVDVSGFTRLSESYAQLGTQGCEEFSLVMSSFLARMCATIETHGGDVDCFAGDALLVVFPVLPGGNGAPPYSERGEELMDPLAGPALSMGAAVLSAKKCAIAICRELNGYRPTEAQPPLGIHAALAAGAVFATECGGATTPRMEAFIAGRPVQELGEAMQLAEDSELVAAGSAVAALPSAWAAAETRGGGCACIRLPKQEAAGDYELHREGSHFGEKHGDVTDDAEIAAVIKYASKKQRIAKATSAHSRAGSTRSFPLKSHRLTSSVASLGTSYGDLLLDDDDSCAESQHPSDTNDTYGLDSLMTFMPDIVRKRCVEGVSLDMLAENRRVSIMFLIADFRGLVLDEKYLSALQVLLGKVIDIAEGEYDGTTRQITVDEKGLAAIFVFGLPGFSYSSHALPCLNAAAKSVDVMTRGGISSSVGLATGNCFCGLVGEASKRCEYAVIGDTVNTAARVAWIARKKDCALLCTEEFTSSLLSTSDISSKIKMSHICSTMLKGKQAEAMLYAPEVGPHQSIDFATSTIDTALDLVDRETQVAAMVDFISSFFSKSDSVQQQQPQSGIMVIDGPVGIGKSSLLSYVHHKAIPSISGVRSLLLRALPNGAPFSLCSQVLQKLLELDGVVDPSTFSRLEGVHMADAKPRQLPRLLAPVAKQLAELHALSDAFEKVAGFQELYRVVLQHALQSRPASVLLVDDAMLADAASKAILIDLGRDPLLLSTLNRRPSHHSSGVLSMIFLGDNASPSDTGSGRQGDQKRFAVIMSIDSTQVDDSLHQMIEGSSLTDLMTDPHLSFLELLPLSKQSVGDLAGQILGKEKHLELLKLDQTMVDVLADKSKGIPLHILELCRWLDDHSMLDMDSLHGAVKLRQRSEVAALIPPSMESIVRNQLDQLAPRMSTVLKCASIQGYSFDVELLEMTVRAEVGLNQETLHLLLFNMANRQLVRASTKPNVWEFCQLSYRDVLYGNILHTHKEKLHRLAADLLREKLQFISGIHSDSKYNQKWDMQERLCHHLTALVKYSQSSSSAECHRDDLKEYSAVMKWLAAGHFKTGHLEEVLKKQTQLQEYIVKPSRLKASASTELLQAQKDVAMYCAELLLALQVSDPAERVLTAAETSNRTSAITEALERLSRTMAETELMPRTSSLGRSVRPAAGGMAVFKANAKMAKVMAKWAPKKRITKHDTDSLLGWYVDEQRLEIKVIYAQFVIITSWPATRYADIDFIARDIFSIWEDAGRPAVPSFFPVKPDTAMGIGLMIGPLMIGNISPSDDQLSIIKRVNLAEYGQRQIVLGKILEFESVWEPHSSPRVKFWHQEIAKETKAANGASCLIFSLTKAVREPLNASVEHAPAFWPFLYEKEGYDVAEQSHSAVTAHKHWERLTRQASAGLETSGYPLYPIVVSRNLVAEGCRVLFPAACNQDWAAPTPAVTWLGLEHLGVTAEAMSKCLKHWEAERIHDHMGCNMFPASLVWARAMLCWFQWQLHLAGRASEHDIEDPRLMNGLAGWPRGPKLTSGGRHPIKEIASRLLLAQAMSMDDKFYIEPLAACLTSTISFARLLAGQGDISLPGVRGVPSKERLPAPSLFVPMEPMLGSAVARRDPEAAIPVVCVQPGSVRALETACNHIQGVMASCITVSSRPLGDPGSIITMSEVGNSETIYEAVMLYKTLRQRLAIMKQRQPSG